MPENWLQQRELPDLRRVDRISIDTETHDVGLQEDRGSSWPWRAGHLCGISIAHRREGGIAPAYFPLQHPDGFNFDRANVARWIKDHIAAGVKFTTMNGIYDFGWIGADLGVAMPPSDRLDELGALAVTIDENHRSYSLDAICARLGLPGKDETVLRDAVVAAGLAPKRKKKFDCRPYIWQLPARFVGPYAEQDAVATFTGFEVLYPKLAQEGTLEAYRLDVDLMPMVLAMRRRGIRIDQDAAEQARDYCLAKRDAALAEISALHGSPVGMDEINGRDWKIKAFDHYAISYPLTPKGNPSFTGNKMQGWMPNHPHWLPRLITIANKYEAAGTKFIEGHILDYVVNGRIHAEIRPFKVEEGGTRSSRFAYADPPLQQMPKHDEELGPLIRRVVLPEQGEVLADADFKQHEFYWMVEHAARMGLRGARATAKLLHDDPKADFHMIVAEMAGLDDRQTAKSVNFARIYGAGVKKMAVMIGKPLAETQAILAQYDNGLPFVSELDVHVKERANRLGYTAMLDGARRHWSLWAPEFYKAKKGDEKRGAGPCEVDEARRRKSDPVHPWYRQRLGRYRTYTALNALIQGTAARHTKLWMREVWRAGIVPMMQMHDSLLCSVTSREQAEMVVRLGLECVTPEEVPFRMDLHYGRNWGDAKHSWEELTGEPAPVKTVNGARPANDVCVGDGGHIGDGGHVGDDVDEMIFDDPFLTALDELKAAEVPPWDDPAEAAGPVQEDDLPAHLEDYEPDSRGTGFKPETPAGHAIDLADIIGGVPRDRKICCPFHADRTPSLHVYRDHYVCFGCGANGDRVGWLMRARDMSYVEALHVLADWDGAAVGGAGTTACDDAKAADPERVARALKWWNEAGPIAGTIAAKYLADERGVDLSALPGDVSERALRFHPACVFGIGAWHPCLLALMRDPVTGAPTGIQRVALTWDAKKIDRMMLGPAGVVQIWPAADRLVIGEGLETTLAAATRLPYRGGVLRPAWSTLSDGGMRTFPVLDGVTELIVLADNDGNGVGQAAADECKQRWLQAGRRGAVLTPSVAGQDFNDVVLDRLKERAA